MSTAGSHSHIVGFEEWLNFAKENKCHLGKYEQIEKDLKVRNEGSLPHSLLPCPTEIYVFYVAQSSICLADQLPNHAKYHGHCSELPALNGIGLHHTVTS